MTAKKTPANQDAIVAPALALPATPIVAPVSPPMSAIHDAAQQAKHLREVLEDGKQRIGCFLGAGCPLGIYDAAEQKSMVLIPAVEELTKRVASGLELAR